MRPLGVIASAKAAAGGGTTVQYIGAYNDDTSQTTYTFSVNIGAAASNRVIFVVVGTRAAGSTSGVTVNGVSATSDVSVAAGTAEVAIWRVVVPSGSGAVNVVVTRSTAESRMNIVTFRVDGTIAVSGATATATTDAATMTVTVPSGGFALAGSTVYAATASDCGWTNATEDGTAVADGIVYTSAAHTTTAGSVGIVADWTVATDPPYSAAVAYSRS